MQAVCIYLVVPSERKIVFSLTRKKKLIFLVVCVRGKSYCREYKTRERSGLLKTKGGKTTFRCEFSSKKEKSIGNILSRKNINNLCGNNSNLTLGICENAKF